MAVFLGYHGEMAKKHGNVFLIGPMGAGKTTVGKALASTIGLEFVDSDREIEHRTGADIPLIFDLEGEEGFRKRERDMIENLSERTGIVLATGGGAILDPQNRARLAGRGTVVYLECSIEQQMERTRHDRNRPLLDTDNPRARLEELMAEREPLYRELADHTVSSGGRNSRAVIKGIVSYLESMHATTIE